MVKCLFCGKRTTLDEAMDDGWFPSFWAGDHEVSEPVCDGCCERFLTHEVGGFVLPERKPAEQPA